MFASGQDRAGGSVRHSIDFHDHAAGGPVPEPIDQPIGRGVFTLADEDEPVRPRGSQVVDHDP